MSFIDWLNSGRAPADAHAAELLALPETAWDRWLSETRGARTAHLLFRLLDVAYDDLDRDPARAAAITALVLRHVDAVEIPAEAGVAGSLLRGRAWTDRGNALLKTDDVRGALRAFERAAHILGTPPFAVECAAARRGEAFARHLLGDSTEALRIIREGLRVFEGHGDAEQVTRSRIYEGIVLFDCGDVKGAASRLAAALDEAAARQDTRTMSRLYNNLGQCAEVLEDRSAAVRYLTRALTLFEELGMTAERPIAVVGLAHVLAGEGLREQAIAELSEAQHTFLSTGRPLQAAMTALDVLELLVRAGDQEQRVSEMASALVHTFAEAGLTREAMRALAHVRAAAGRHALRVEDLQMARTFMDALTHDPRATF